MTNPANRLPPEYDDMQPNDYDPAFTASISTQMRVPDRLGFANGLVNHEEADPKNAFEENRQADIHRTAEMNVPDKIVVVGQERAVGLRQDANLHMDFAAQPPLSSHHYVGLTTPPRVLKLDDQPFWAAYENQDLQEGRSRTTSGTDMKLPSAPLPNGFVTPERRPVMDTLEDQAFMRTPGDSLLLQDDEEHQVALMQRQIAKLSRHVLRLEDENGKRATRELFLYPAVLGYILFQVAKWFLSNK